MGVDYWYITSEGLKLRKELGHEQSADGNEAVEDERRQGRLVKCLTIRCYETKAVFSHVVPVKGADEDNYASDLTVSAVTWMGHVKLTLKSDYEPALMTLARRALETIKCQVENIEQASMEQSQEYDSQTIGGTEIGIRAVGGCSGHTSCVSRRMSATSSRRSNPSPRGW